MSSSDYRARARQMLSGKWGMAILTTFVAGVLGGLITGSVGVNISLSDDIYAKLPQIIKTYFKIAASIGSVLAFETFIIGGTVKLGYCKYLLKLHDGQEGHIKDLFSEFDRIGDGVLLSLLTALYVFLWSLLFVIPGIVAAYKYAMAPFILLENPGMRPNDAITASKEMMDGHKGELFCLDLSFIGWALLNVLTLGIGSFWLNPYVNAAYAAFYRDLRPVFFMPKAIAPTGEFPWDQPTDA